MVVVVIRLMKAAAAQSSEKDVALRNNVVHKLKHLISLYLCDKMACRAESGMVNR